MIVIEHLKPDYTCNSVSGQAENCKYIQIPFNLSRNRIPFLSVCQFLAAISEVSKPITDTRRNSFRIWRSWTEFRLYLLFSDWFDSKRNSVRCQFDRNMVITIKIGLIYPPDSEKISQCKYIYIYMLYVFGIKEDFLD